LTNECLKHCAKIHKIINNLARDCSISLKFRTDFDHVTLDVPQTFKVRKLYLHYRQHIGEMRSNAAETGSSQAGSDAGYDKQLSSATQDIP